MNKDELMKQKIFEEPRELKEVPAEDASNEWIETVTDESYNTLK